KTPSRTSRTSYPTGSFRPKRGAKRSCVSTSTRRTRLPREAATTARAAESVVLPVPPLPDWMMSRLVKRSSTGSSAHLRKPGPQRSLAGPDHLALPARAARLALVLALAGVVGLGAEPVQAALLERGLADVLLHDVLPMMD